jgi:hypothetical protein
MRDDTINQPAPDAGPARQRSLDLRNALLALHKTLIDSERVRFEQTMGKIQSPNHFLQLLTRDPWFTWLQPLSSLIVSIDDLLDQKALTMPQVDALVTQSSLLLVPAERDQGFAGHYFEALQRDPAVVLAHAELNRLLGPRTLPKGTFLG